MPESVNCLYLPNGASHELSLLDRKVLFMWRERKTGPPIAAHLSFQPRGCFPSSGGKGCGCKRGKPRFLSEIMTRRKAVYHGWNSIIVDIPIIISIV